MSTAGQSGAMAQSVQQLKLTEKAARSLKQADPRKQTLVWLIKSRTVLRDEWLVSRLHMGHRSNISRAISAVRNPKSREHERLQKLLHICTD